ncbi:MAG: TetR/AcrR family transcriptional regulator [Anaerolineales bacterium]|nr:TetR/AcrR family transcriptional regulator [Anaerolineales bacterium]
MPKGIPLTPEELDRRRREIFAHAVELFVNHGFRETSMRQVAEAAGMGKSSLYDYFKTKEDILVWAVEDQIGELTLAAQQIASQPLPAPERLRQIMRLQLDYLLSRKDFYVKLMFEVQRLSRQSQQRIQTRRHAYQDLVRHLIEDGIREGAFRPVDALLVARTLITVLTPTVFTTRPTGTPEEMLASAIDIVLKGIQV